MWYKCYTVYVIVCTIYQSESEKKLMKEIRREEKRLNRRMEKQSAGTDNSNNSGIVLDTDQLRAIRSAML